MKYKSHGFTIVELLIVIVAYNGITRKAQDATLQSDLKNANTTLEVANATNGTYPADTSSLRFSPNTIPTYTYNSSSNTYCLQVSSTKTTSIYSISSGGSIANGKCIIAGSFIQDTTTANCPITRTRAVDARDNHTYWVQKLADGKCWMLTNLAYGGGGTNTYGDVIPTGSGSAGTLSGPDNSGSSTYTLAKYYIPTGSNVTTEPANPSISTTGTGQYGYFYNWCAAMGGQTGNGACSSTDATQPNVNTTICPKNWRLPTGGGGEFAALNTAINSGSTSSPAGLLSAWLAQYEGIWYAGFSSQGTFGFYWSSTVLSTAYAYSLRFNTSSVSPANNNDRDNAFAVRCLAAV